MAASPATLTDWLGQVLEEKLATLPDDAARVRLLAQQFGVWSYRMREFYRTDGDSEAPHPTYGYLSATDFLIVLGMIDGARAKIERQAVPA